MDADGPAIIGREQVAGQPHFEPIFARMAELGGKGQGRRRAGSDVDDLLTDNLRLV